MASKQWALRRKRIVQEDPGAVLDEDNDFEQMKSPVRKLSKNACQSNTGSPRFRSPKVTPTTAGKCVNSPSTPLNDSKDQLSQEPTPSKWSYLLPDFNSQPEGVVCDVLWDCASPDAVKHLKRLPKNDNSIKELVKYFKEPPIDKRTNSPPLQLQALRAALRKHLQRQKQKPVNNDKKKNKKLEEEKKKREENRERAKELLGQMLSAVRRREELETRQKEAYEKEGKVIATAVVAEGTGEADDDDDNEDDDCWEDDDLFLDNSFIIAATQNPEQFLAEISASTYKTSTPKGLGNYSSCTQESFRAKDGKEDLLMCDSSVTDSQSLVIIPPTFVPGGIKHQKESSNIESKMANRFQARGWTIPQPKNLLKTFELVDSSDDGSDIQTTSSDDYSAVKHKQGMVKGPSSTAAQSALTRGLNGIHHRPTAKVPICNEKKRDKMQKCANDGRTKTTSPRKLGDEMLNEGLSDEMLLRLTDNCEISDSQAIQEYPTQAPAKLSKPVALESGKTSTPNHSDDLTDYLDPVVLAAISEYDSFSESPQKKVNVSKKNIAPQKHHLADIKYGHGEINQAARLHCAGNKQIVKIHTSSCTHPQIISNVGAQGKMKQSSTVQPRTDQSETSKSPLYSSNAQSSHKNLRPLSSLACDNTIIENPGRKFKSKTLPSSTKCSSKNDRNTAVVDATCNSLKEVDVDDMLDDDPLYESEILAMLDEVESQASQRMASQAVSCTQVTSSPPKCSQEQIEKKRQAAVKKLQSKHKR